MVLAKAQANWGRPSPALGASIASSFHGSRALGGAIGLVGFGILAILWDWLPGWELALISLAVAVHGYQRREVPQHSVVISLAVDLFWMGAFLTLTSAPAWTAVPGLGYLVIAAVLALDGWRAATAVIALKGAVAILILISVSTGSVGWSTTDQLALGVMAVLIHLPSMCWLISTSTRLLRSRQKMTDALEEKERALRQVDSERQLVIQRIEFQASLLDQVRTMVVAADLSGALIYANANAVAVLGIRPEQLKHRRLLDLVTDESRHALVGTRLEGTWQGETTLTGVNGEAVQSLVTLTQIRNRAGEPIGLGAIAVDISERKRTEERLAALLASKGEFVTSVSHELRTPLTVILGMAEELRNSFDEFGPEVIKDLIDVIADQANDLSDIVQDLLVMGRSDAGGSIVIEPKEVNLDRELADCLKHYLPEDHPVEAEFGSSRPVLADPLRLRQVVRNLLTNAVRYGGPRLRVCVKQDDQFTTVSLWDDGPGIPAEDVEEIFEPYVRSSSGPALPGSMGLGLAVARRLSQLMGGDLVYRRDGAWSIFEMSVPTSAVTTHGAWESESRLSNGLAAQALRS